MDWVGLWETYNTLLYGVGVQAMLALSIYLTLSCGLLSVGNAAFMGIGAYASALLTLRLGLPFPLVLVCGGMLPAFVALVIGIPVLRLSNVYLAMATLSFGEVVRVVLTNLDFTGGPMGLVNVPVLTQWWHVAICLFIVIYAVYALVRSKVGRAFEAIREDETAARIMGVNAQDYKLLAFTLGAFIAGVAGALNAHYTSTLSPREFGFSTAVNILTMAVLGGTRSFVGPMIGSTILAVLPEALRFLKDFRMAFNGLVLVVIVLYLPGGIWDPSRFRKRRLGRAANGKA